MITKPSFAATLRGVSRVPNAISPFASPATALLRPAASASTPTFAAAALRKTSKIPARTSPGR